MKRVANDRIVIRARPGKVADAQGEAWCPDRSEAPDRRVGGTSPVMSIVARCASSSPTRTRQCAHTMLAAAPPTSR